MKSAEVRFLMSDNDIDGRLREVEMESAANRITLASHEKECAVRYAHINENITDLKRWVLGFGAGLIVGMGGILAKLVFG
jgi:hypothetical protein